jgi:hypothetical protein
MIAVRAGAGKIVSGSPARELMSGEDGGGKGEWAEMDACTGGGVDAGCRWLEQPRNLYLDWGYGLAFDIPRGASTAISTSWLELICLSSEGSLARATRRRFFCGLVIGVNIWRRFPFLRSDTRGKV